jgi:hypothetical protein
MNIEGWPALAQYSSGWHEVPYERAIYGKVPGQRSDYRWIGRSRGFQGHQWQIHRRLSIGLEDKPGQMPAWYFDRVHDRCYAVSRYPSAASDATDRSESFEKQILEWRPAAGQHAAAALVLLKEASTFSRSEWMRMSGASGNNWQDPEYCLDLPNGRKKIDGAGLQSIIQTGLRDLGKIAEDALAAFYVGFRRRYARSAFDQTLAGPPAFLLMDGQLTPEALAALLLPVQDKDLKGICVAGGLPVNKVDERELRSWDGLPYQPAQLFREPPPLNSSVGEHVFARMVVTALRNQAYPRTAPLLEFALGPERWRDKPLLNQLGELTEQERKVVDNAVDIVLADSKSDIGLNDEKLVDARRRHLESKADVIKAAVLQASPGAFKAFDRKQGLISVIEDSWTRH